VNDETGIGAATIVNTLNNCHSSPFDKASSDNSLCLISNGYMMNMWCLNHQFPLYYLGCGFLPYSSLSDRNYTCIFLWINQLYQLLTSVNICILKALDPNFEYGHKIDSFEEALSVHALANQNILNFRFEWAKQLSYSSILILSSSLISKPSRHKA
jgi:hypothetical protein